MRRVRGRSKVMDFMDGGGVGLDRGGMADPGRAVRACVVVVSSFRIP